MTDKVITSGQRLRTRQRLSLAEILPLVPEQHEIPKLIHQTYPNRPLPDEIRLNVESIKSANPDWNYRLYDDEDVVQFIGKHYGPRVLDYFERLNPKYGAARADLFRYLLMYRLGGVYLDIKSSLHRPLSEVLRPDDRYILSHWKNKPGEQYAGWGLWRELPDTIPGEYQQWHLVAAPGHPLLRAVLEKVLGNIDRYVPWVQGTGKMGVIRVTGPIAYTSAIFPIIHQHQHRLLDSHQELGFEYSIYSHAGTDAHNSIFAMHYSQLDEPIVRLSFQEFLKASSANPAKAALHLFRKGRRSLLSAVHRDS